MPSVLVDLKAVFESEYRFQPIAQSLFTLESQAIAGGESVGDTTEGVRALDARTRVPGAIQVTGVENAIDGDVGLGSGKA
jgi:hypothetical protein